MKLDYTPGQTEVLRMKGQDEKDMLDALQVEVEHHLAMLQKLSHRVATLTRQRNELFRENCELKRKLPQ